MKLSKRIKNTFITNPILTKEVRLKFRQKKFFWIASLYVLATFVSVVFFLKAASSYSYSAADFITWLSQSARRAFIFLSFWQFGIVALITISFSSACITAEKEQKTLILLFSSQLDSYMIIFGKFITACIYNIVIITILLPVFSIIFSLGGISVSEILLSFALIFLGTSLFTAIAIFWSTVLKKTVVANIVSVITGAAFVTVPLFLPYIVLHLFKLEKMFSIAYRDVILLLPQHMNPSFPLILMFEKSKMIGTTIFKHYSYKTFIFTSSCTIIVINLVLLFVSALILKKKLIKE